MPRWPGTPEERLRKTLATKVKQDGECLRFDGSHDKLGYGRINYQGVNRLAHVLAYEMANGPVPDGLDVDHVYDAGCRHRDCIRTDHLEAVTTAENCQRGRPYHKVGLCAKGIHPQTGPGKCEKCRHDYMREYGRRWRLENPEKSRASSRAYQARKRAERKASV